MKMMVRYIRATQDLDETSSGFDHRRGLLLQMLCSTFSCFFARLSLLTVKSDARRPKKRYPR